MRLIINIPKEFEQDFNKDRFEDSFARVASDIESFGFQLAGRYEQETITMLREAFRNCKVLPEHHGRLIDYRCVVDAIDDWIKREYSYTNATYYLRKRVKDISTIIEGE